MGYGDEILGSGMAKGAHARGKRIAFGDGQRIIWSQWCEEVYRGNPNVARPGDELCNDLQWIAHYKGKRAYVLHHGERWKFNPNFRAIPGEIYFDAHELSFAKSIQPGFVLIEPRVKPVYPNKQWPIDRYARVAHRLTASGYRVVQCQYGNGPLNRLGPAVEIIPTETFRHGLAVLSRSALYIGPEGGMTHGAAALDVRAVVLFGGFSDPRVLGYEYHAQLTGGAEPCGSIQPCGHCRAAMAAITVDQVFQSAMMMLERPLARAL